MIVTLCATSCLPTLALVSKEFKEHAEQLLYATVTIYTHNDGHTRPLDAILSSMGHNRAVYVKFLSIEFNEEPRVTDAALLQLLLDSGPSMRNLKDIRLNLRDDLAGHNHNLNEFLW